MFVYFIQRKAFSTATKIISATVCATCKDREKGDQFHSFYRHFLLRLFHEGSANVPAPMSSTACSVACRI